MCSLIVLVEVILNVADLILPRLTPIVWNNVQQVWPQSAPITTQTECKIMAFTTIGTTNVIGMVLLWNLIQL